MPDDPLNEALAEHSRQIDTAVERFLHDLARVLAIASAGLQQRLFRLLKFDPDGRISATPSNQQTLRRLSLLWQEALDHAGLDPALNSYLETFPAQIPAFYTILRALNNRAKEPLPLPKFSRSDHEYFSALRMSAGADIAATVEGAAQNTASRSIFAVGGVSFRSLSETLAKQVGASQARAEALADTSLMQFYRTISDRGFQRVEDANPGTEFRYRYAGPLDRITRPFCRHLREVNKTYTREQIGRMSNGQLPNVFVSAGGWNCRHQWVASLEPLTAKAAA